MAELREIVPDASPADAPTIEALALVLAQLERAHLVLAAAQDDDGDRDELRRLAQDARGWTNVALRYFEVLGLSPTSRARLGVDLARMEPSMVRVLQEQARSRS